MIDRTAEKVHRIKIVTWCDDVSGEEQLNYWYTRGWRIETVTSVAVFDTVYHTAILVRRSAVDQRNGDEQ